MAKDETTQPIEGPTRPIEGQLALSPGLDLKDRAAGAAGVELIRRLGRNPEERSTPPDVEVWQVKQSTKICVLRILRPDGYLTKNPRGLAALISDFKNAYKNLASIQDKRARIPDVLDQGIIETGEHALPWVLVSWVEGTPATPPHTILNPAQRCMHGNAIVKQGLRTLEWLHEQGYSHGDIKPENMVLRNDIPRDYAGIFDTDHLVGVKQRRSTIPGTRLYRAPEGNTSWTGDVYAIGVIAQQSTTGLDLNQLDAPLKKTAERLRGIGEICTHTNPKIRPTAAEALKILVAAQN